MKNRTARRLLKYRRANKRNHPFASDLRIWETTVGRIAAFLLTLAYMMSAGCLADRHTTPRIAPQFYGVWHNVEERYHNWWEIRADSVVNYGVSIDHGENGTSETGGTCHAYIASILLPDSVDVPFGNAGTVRLAIVGDELVLEGEHGRAYHERVAAGSICKRTDGTYYEGAPYNLARALLDR